MNYASWVTTVTTLLEVPLGTSPASATPSTDANFNNMIAPCIDFVENRLQRELDLINTVVTNSSGVTAANTRSFSYPTNLGTFIVVNQLSLFVGSVRQPAMTPVSRDFIDACYPAETAPTIPSYPIYWAPANDTTAILGPSPDAIYTCEVVGTMRMSQMSNSNPSNFLTLQLPDLYIAASMAWLCAYQRDFGTAAADPQMAMSWSQTYDKLFAGADAEELRKKFRSIGQSSRSPSPLANQPGT